MFDGILPTYQHFDPCRVTPHIMAALAWKDHKKASKQTRIRTRAENTPIAIVPLARVWSLAVSMIN